MFEEFEIRTLPLSLKSVRSKVEQFLEENGLKMDRLDYYAGIFRDEEMLAGGGFEDDVMKCIAVSPQARELNLTNKLVTHLRAVGYERGYKNLFVFTKPENEVVFTSLAFHVIGRAGAAILLESDLRGITDYTRGLSLYKKEGKNGCVVMNCNPMTLGHRYLIETAAKQVDTLHLFVVSEDRSEFSSADRLQMVKDGTSDLRNVIVHEGGKYLISSATFPGYFIKNMDEVTTTHIELDLNLFTTYIAPALAIGTRFVGSEPLDLLTKRYNEQMKAILPKHGIEVVEVERMQKESNSISASYVRNLIHSYSLQEAYALIPASSKSFVMNKCAEQIANTAVSALREELDTTPKPGLVDKNDCGAHTDMDINLMHKSIDSLYPYFLQLAETGLKWEAPCTKELIDQVRSIGIQAEVEMLKTTGGVNTHRGAIFSIGLCIAAVASILSLGKELSVHSISETISMMTENFEKQDQSNGGSVCKKYRIKGALDNAREGYADLFDKVLPVYQELKQSEADSNTANIRTLLYIMSILDDTNVYHRKGAESAVLLKERASTLYQNYNEQKVEEMNRSFVRENISPGGSADMLAMIIFINEILKKRETHLP